MSQQEDMVAQDAGHDEETGSYVAVSPAADEAGGAGDTAGEAVADLEADEEPTMPTTSLATPTRGRQPHRRR